MSLQVLISGLIDLIEALLMFGADTRVVSHIRSMISEWWERSG